MLRMDDAGFYECQANTEPKEQFAINLQVEDTIAVISGWKIHAMWKLPKIFWSLETLNSKFFLVFTPEGVINETEADVFF